jgi:hypothetical protein
MVRSEAWLTVQSFPRNLRELIVETWSAPRGMEELRGMG